MSRFDYLNPAIPAELTQVTIPAIDATVENLRGYGLLVDDPKAKQIEIIRPPSTGSRPVDENSCDEGGISEGAFIAEWKSDLLYGRKSAALSRHGHSRAMASD